MLLVFFVSFFLHFCGYSFFPDDFDPGPIAEKIRILADKLDEDMKFKAALNDFKKAAAQEVGYTHAQRESIICWHLRYHSDGMPWLPS